MLVVQFFLFTKQSQTINHLKEVKSEPNVRALLQQICDLVQREELNASLASLDLLDNMGSSAAQAGGSASNSEPAGADSLPLYIIKDQFLM